MAITHIAVTTAAALSVPLLLLRRHRNNAIKHALRNPAPPRRAALPPALPAARPAPHPAPSPPPEPPHDHFNGALYSAKAFAIATALVAAAAASTGCALTAALGVRNTQDFAARMRARVAAALPGLAARTHAQDGAEQRLRDAFDAGGLGAWAAAAAEEAEGEAARGGGDER